MVFLQPGQNLTQSRSLLIFISVMSRPFDGRSTSDSQVTPLEAGLLNSQLSTMVNINYDDGKNAYVPVIDLLRRFLIGEKCSLVIIGEENFTFSVAIAAMCGSWDGIPSCTRTRQS